MGRHFISVLGTGLYQSTTYVYEEKCFETPLVQEALAEMLFSETKQGDKISIFVTEKAKELNWETRKYSEREQENAKKNGQVLPDIKIGLKEILLKKYGQILDDIELCTVPIGSNENELWEIFQIIFSRIEEDEELYIDITHSLRNIPIQMLAVISYARVLKRITVKGIYYGAFEAKDELKRTPIFNLRTFLEILDWSQAANTFVKYGNSDQIYELCLEQKKIYREKISELFKITKELNCLTHNLETSRGYYKDGKNREMSALGTYKEYKKNYFQMMEKDQQKEDRNEKQTAIIKPMEGLLQCIDKSVEIFDVDTNLEMGMAAVRWAIDKKNTQQGFTAFEETIKTFLCNYYGLDEKEEKDRDWISKNICRELSENYDEKNKKFRNGKTREDIYKQWLEEKKEHDWFQAYLPQTDKMQEMFLDIPESLFVLIPKIGDRRNSMNHFGFSNRYQFSSKGLEKDLKSTFEAFEQIKKQMEEKKKSR